jgi:phage shock protein A
MEDRIRLEEARAAAASEMADRATLEDRFDALESSDELDQQLEDLRTKVKGQLPRPGDKAAAA